MIHEFCDHCPDCRPGILDIKTGKLLPEDSPTMRQVNAIWNTATTYAERKAFIDFTMGRDHSPSCERLARQLIAKLARKP